MPKEFIKEWESLRPGLCIQFSDSPSYNSYWLTIGAKEKDGRVDLMICRKEGTPATYLRGTSRLSEDPQQFRPNTNYDLMSCLDEPLCEFLDES